jgi:hypothetical protein
LWSGFSFRPGLRPGLKHNYLYALGYRASEVPLPQPRSDLVQQGLATIKLPGCRRERSVNFRALRPECIVNRFAPLSPDRHDPHTVECCFLARLMRDLPVPQQEALQGLSDYVRDFVATLPKVDKLPFEDWLNSTSYNDNRKDQLRTAELELRGGYPTKKQRSAISTHIKNESYASLKNSRAINSRSDIFKAWSGPYFKAIENLVYDLDGDVRFIKHIPMNQRATEIAKLKCAGCHYYATDFTAYESHFTPAFLWACECQLYQAVLEERAGRIIAKTLAGPNRMSTRTGISATIMGRRMSGDMCTSLGNGFANMMLIKYIVHTKGGHVAGFVEGDDGIFATDVVITEEDYLALGFTIKIIEVPDPCVASFCGLIFGENGDVIRDPVRFVQKYFWTSSFLTARPRIMNELLRAKALSAYYETPNCPIIQAIVQWSLDNTTGVVPRFVDDGYHVIPRDIRNVKFCSISDETRELFHQQFAISPAAQVYAESEIRTKGNFDCLRHILPVCPIEHSFFQEYSDRYLEYR